MSIEAHEEKIALLDMLLKIKEAENDVENNRVSDAFTSLKNIREKYNV